MAREGGGAMGMGTLIFVGIGILTLAIVFMLAPQIGGQMDAAMPALGASSDWNATHNTNLKTGADIWGTLSPFVMIAGLVVIAAFIIMVLMMMRAG